MYKLINLAKSVLSERQDVPFSVYASVKEQRLFNVPIVRPLLIFVLDGQKQLGRENSQICSSGEFIFLSNTPKLNMRNIPSEAEYFALLIDFDYQDFQCFEDINKSNEDFIKGPIDDMLYNTLLQFIEWTRFAPKELWGQRRQEILKLLYHLGFKGVSGILEPPSLSYQVQQRVSEDVSTDLGLDTLCKEFAMSDSTFRRKLQKEGTSFQDIKDQVKLGTGLHLLQTTQDPIGRIAEQCGYQSQSRFTDKFKQLFGLTPSALRKTRLPD